jgi:acyl-CoA dehydrogenase
VSGYYEAQMSRLAANFAFASDVGLTLGGGLKTAEFLSGRYSDVMSNLYLGYACLWYHAQNKHVKGIDAVLDLAMARICADAQEALFGIYSNFPVPLLGPLMQLVTFPRGREYSQPSDRLRGKVSDLMTTPTELRAFLTENVFVSKNPNDRVNQIARAVSLAVEADRALSLCRKEKREPTKEEAAKIEAAEALREQIIQVRPPARARPLSAAHGPELGHDPTPRASCSAVAEIYCTRKHSLRFRPPSHTSQR